jgi:hypothetical protein
MQRMIHKVVWVFVSIGLLYGIEVGKSQQHVAPKAGSDLYFNITVDYGVQLMVTDSQGRKTGHDQRIGQSLNEIPDSSYFDDSISDATDNSPDAAVSESRVLQIHPHTQERYLLKVSPTDRESYNIEFSCTGINRTPVDISAEGIRISPQEEHLFVLTATPSCSNGFVFGAFEERTGLEAPLLTYAYPTSNRVRIASENAFHLVVVYGARITPSTFAATLDGNMIGNLFQPKQNAIETAIISVRPGHHVIRLSVSGTSEQGAKLTTENSFIVDAE